MTKRIWKSFFVLERKGPREIIQEFSKKKKSFIKRLSSTKFLLSLSLSSIYPGEFPWSPKDLAYIFIELRRGQGYTRASPSSCIMPLVKFFLNVYKWPLNLKCTSLPSSYSCLGSYFFLVYTYYWVFWPDGYLVIENMRLCAKMFSTG